MRTNNAGSPKQVSDTRDTATWDDASVCKGVDCGECSNCSPVAADEKSPPALFFIAIAIAIVLISMGYSLTVRVANNQYSPTFANRITQTTIDPNTANWASLVRIPGIGPARAEKLLAWRKTHVSKAMPVVFKNLEDLRHIPSFGPKTVAGIAEYLRFPRQRSVGGHIGSGRPTQAAIPTP